MLAVLAAGGAEARAEAPPQVIAQAQADLDGDGRTETLEVLLLQGERRDDAEPWCGAGDKWEGRFALRVRRGPAVLTQARWESLIYPRCSVAADESFFFWAPLTLHLADYNGDGHPDFSLGVYGNCNGNFYRLFTLGPDGRLAELPTQGGGALTVSGAGHHNSTPLIRVEKGLLVNTYYDQAKGEEVTVRRRWQNGRFVPVAP
ncbi:hypothetical protein FAK_03250 [Desulfoferula mesophila]|uniref:Uncharacterized protein n=2 Tax=Desulfoferula mesophila TaxID=3058419 RepID=A0AAU9EDC9_9BACT|nr:hypothetical protein FAK_03250 [Desulfoferula mesophilus]